MKNDNYTDIRQQLAHWATANNKYLTIEIIKDWSNKRLFANIHPIDRALLGVHLSQIGFLN